MTQPEIDWLALTDEESEALYTQAREDRERRQRLRDIPAEVDRLAAMFSSATGRKDGDEWEPPAGAHNSYPKDSTAQHNGKMWVSVIPANVWEPGGEGWREVIPEPVEGTEPVIPDWVQPGSTNPYLSGDEVRHKDAVWSNTHGDGNVWEPGVYGWTKH